MVRPEKGGAEGVDAIEHGLDAKLFGIDAAFLVDLRVAMKPGGDLLLDGRIREQVARKLLDRELVKWHVAIKRVDHPIAVFPDLSWCINAE